MKSLSTKFTSLTAFLLELLVYSGFVASYFFLVLHFMGDRIDQVFKSNKIHYAFMALVLIVVQGFVLERLTTFVMWMIQRLQAIIPALMGLARPHDTITRPKKVPGVLVYAFAGPLLAVNADYFARRVQEVIDEADPLVTIFLINAEAIIDMDTTAVEILTALHDILKEKNIEFGICEVKGNFRKMLMSTPLPRRVGFNVYNSVSEALQEIGKKRQGLKK